jgi:hypothetical protein
MTSNKNNNSKRKHAPSHLTPNNSQVLQYCVVRRCSYAEMITCSKNNNGIYMMGGRSSMHTLLDGSNCHVCHHPDYKFKNGKPKRCNTVISRCLRREMNSTMKDIWDILDGK